MNEFFKYRFYIKSRNIFLFFLCLLRFIIKGRSVKNVRFPKKILIVQMAKLGDMVCTTPMFRAIKKQHPESKVYVMGSVINKEVVRGNQDVDKYFCFTDNIYKTVRLLCRQNIDFACTTAPDFVSLALLYLSGIPIISTPVIKNGFSPYETKLYKILRYFVIRIPHKMGSYAPREYLRLLEPIGIFSANTAKHLSYSNGAENVVLNFFKTNNINFVTDVIVGISPSAGNKIKKWPSEKFALFADFIYKEYEPVLIIIGGEKDKEEVEEMVNLLNNKTKVFNTLMMFNIDELKALISKMKMFVSVDTGPIYIAEAFGVPTIDIVGPMDENEQPPIGSMHKIVKLNDRKKPEMHIMNARSYNKNEAMRQINDITIDMVIKVFKELYFKIN